MTMSPVARQERARIASLSRSRTADDPDLIEARRNLRAASLESHVLRILDEAPPLTAEQRQHIAGLLVAGGASK